MGHLTATVALGPASAALTKTILWIIGLGFAIKFRRLLFTVAAIISTCSSIVRGCTDAGIHVSYTLAQGVVYWSAPGVAMIIAAFIAGRYTPVWIGRGWRL